MTGEPARFVIITDPETGQRYRMPVDAYDPYWESQYSPEDLAELRAGQDEMDRALLGDRAPRR